MELSGEGLISDLGVPPVGGGGEGRGGGGGGRVWRGRAWREGVGGLVGVGEGAIV